MRNWSITIIFEETCFQLNELCETANEIFIMSSDSHYLEMKGQRFEQAHSFNGSALQSYS